MMYPVYDRNTSKKDVVWITFASWVAVLNRF